MGFNDFLSKGQSLASSGANTVGSAFNSIKSGASSALAGLESKIQGFSAAGSLKNLGSLIRTKNFGDIAAGLTGQEPTAATFESPTGRDWRVRLSLPQSFASSELLAPLQTTAGFVFPYTPQITVAHSANYQALEPVHNNYPFFAYQNSKVEQITITGQFVVEDGFEAAYWVGAVHYLRSVTKMNFGGDTSESGAPPPVVRLDGYGDYVFNNVPVVVTNFTVDMPNDVDYISTQINGSGQVSYVPVKSQITVTVQPIYSREEVRQFNLADFVNGGYLNGQGYI